MASWVAISFETPSANPLTLSISVDVTGEPLKDEISIPEGTTRLYSYAFNSCQSIKKVILPATLQYVGDEVFNGCKNLTDLVMPSLENYLNLNYDSDNSLLTFGNNANISFEWSKFSNIVESDFEGIEEKFKADYNSVDYIKHDSYPDFTIIFDNGRLSVPDSDVLTVTITTISGTNVYHS